MAHRSAVDIGSLPSQLRIERVNVRDEDVGGGDSLLLGSRNEQQGDLVSIHDAEIVLLIVDLEAEHVLIIGNAASNVVVRELWLGLFPHRGRSRGRGGVVGLAEPRRWAVPVCGLASSHLY